MALLATLVAAPLAAQVPTPESVLGFRVGQDSMLASWRQINDYFARLAAASPKVRLDTLGRTTQDRPLLAVTISDAANLARIPELLEAQRRLADPRTLDSAAAARLVATQPAVVVIQCSIHSNEIGASQMAMELAWRLATDTAMAEVLRRVVLVLLPAANPDGIDIVGDWYRASRGTPWDGTSPPWLWHPFIGHDDNRDWYMLTQPETRQITRMLYRQWLPEVFYDIHQKGASGSRMFVPPFADPVNPNLDPALVEATSLAGTTMGQALLDAGLTGVSHRERFDLWWHGGARSTPIRHNMVGILSEAASARVATPQCQSPAGRQPETGTDYPAPWSGACWRLRDIVDYELVTSTALLGLVADHRAEFVRRFLEAGRRAIAAGRSAPYAFILPADGGDAGARALLGNILIQSGVEVHRATTPLAANGTTYPAGSLVIRLDQPFRAHVKDLFERQDYPDRRLVPGGPPAVPYDVAGWTLPLQMGLRVDHAMTPLEGAVLERLDTVVAPPGTVTGRGDIALLDNRSNAQITATWQALAAGGSAELAAAPFTVDGRTWPTGTLVVRGARAVIERAARTRGFDAVFARQVAVPAGSPRVRGVPRVALYRSWNASVDEGWTRWVFEQLGVGYTTVTDSVVRHGDLRSRFDVVVLPSETEAAIAGGRRPGTAPTQYTGGLGREGREALRAFLAEGGTVIALDDASRYAIGQLGAPARAVRTSRAADPGGETGPAEAQDTGAVFRFSAPGSIFETVTDRNSPIASGMDAATQVYFISSTILEAGPGAHAVLTYPQGHNPLLSGYVFGPEVLGGRAALVDAPVGRGRAILFGFRPQHRGQTHGTFRLLTNAILVGAGSAPARTATPAARNATGR